MQQILRLARRDEWVRLFSTILAPFPHSQSTDVEPCTEGNMEEVQEEVEEACKVFIVCTIYYSVYRNTNPSPPFILYAFVMDKSTLCY